MSAEKPEVKKPEIRDVWENIDSKVKFVFLDYNQGSKDLVAFSQRTKCIWLFDENGTMPERFKYIGKSKANINDLFEVDDYTSTDIIDRNIRKENMRLQAENNRLKKALEYALEFYNYCEMQQYPCVLTKDFKNDKDIISKALNGESEEK